MTCFTVFLLLSLIGLCSLRKNDARLVVLLVFLAVSFQNFCTNFSNGSDQFAQKTSRKEAKFSLYFSSDFPASTSCSAHVLFTCSTILCLV